MDKRKLINTIYGKKVGQTQQFDDRGTRIPVSIVEIAPCLVSQIKDTGKDGYAAVQLAFGTRKIKNINKPELGHLGKTGAKIAPRFLKEVELNTDSAAETELKVGDTIKAEEVLQNGDLIDVTGTSRGKGFTGVVKRHHFKGGPRTHGQSDRERAPGSIGQTTTPGRVYKGKRMAGRSGGETITVKNLKIVNIDSETNRLIIKGLIPGVANSVISITRKS